MSKSGATKAAKQREVQALVAKAAAEHEQKKALEAAQEHIERSLRVNNVFGLCRAQIINEPALWFRAPEHEGAMIGEARLRELHQAMMRAASEQAGLVLPDGVQA